MVWTPKQKGMGAAAAVASVAAIWGTLRPVSGSGPSLSASEPTTNMSIAAQGIETPASAPIVHQSSTSAQVVRSLSWPEKMDASGDLRALIVEATASAFRGDGAAQIAIARSMWNCNVVAFGPGRESQAASAFPPETSWQANRATREEKRCQHLREADPFADLPYRPGGYSDGYWVDLADETGVPLAQAMKAMGLMSTLVAKEGDLGGLTQAKAGDIQQRLEAAVRGGDPAAYVYVGMTLGFADSAPEQPVAASSDFSTQADSKTSTRQAAWLLVGCNMTNGCDDPAFTKLSLECPERSGPNCNFRTALIHTLRTNLSADEYQKALALSAQLQDAIEHHRWDEINLQLSAGGPA